MEFNLLAEMQRDGFSVCRKSSSRGGQYNGPCILGCGGLGNDRMWVQPSFGEYGWFKCNVCESKGSGVDYLMMKRGYTKHQALAEVGWKPKDGSIPKFTIPKNVLAGEIYPTHAVPSKSWQDSAKAFIEYCEGILWSEQGQLVLEYLRARGLHDETIKMARIGYNSAELRQSATRWGREKHGKLWQGIVIPWFLGDDIWRITVRDENAIHPNDRYKQIAGGSNGLYLSFLLGYERPVVLVEGELDALSIAQEAGHYVSPCATGSTEGSHTTRWIAALAQKDMVLIAFDAEESGDKAASWWLKQLENAHRLRPWWKDANQMLQDGVDLLNDWILPRIDIIADGEKITSALSDGYEKCAGCKRPFPSFEGWDPKNIPDDDVAACDPVDGEMYCEQCRPELFKPKEQLCGACLDLGKDTPAPHEIDGFMYCDDHFSCVQLTV